jgi:tetratricopeptide (TPR) repeat protein
LEEIQLALALDPLSLVLNFIKGWLLFYSRQYDKSIEQYQSTLELDSNYLVVYANLGYVYLEKGMYEEAIAAIKKGGRGKQQLGYAYARSGKKEMALAILQEMREQWNQGQGYALHIAWIYTALGEEELALDWLEIAVERREPNVKQLKICPRVDSLRSNPRFKALLKKMNLE